MCRSGASWRAASGGIAKPGRPGGMRTSSRGPRPQKQGAAHLWEQLRGPAVLVSESALAERMRRTTYTLTARGALFARNFP